jgi:CHAD domain-containing protein
MELTPDSPLWAWAYDAIDHRQGTMLEHADGVREGADIEAVHDMRVGSRRLVAAMKVFASCFPSAEYRKLLKEARDVTRKLGAVRDLDVLIDHYEHLLPETKADERLGVKYFLAFHQRERKQARRPMLRALDELERSKFPKRVQAFVRHEADRYREKSDTAAKKHKTPPTADGNVPFREAAPRLLVERYAELYSFAEHVSNPAAVEELHEMRIAAKWLRYTMELFAPAYADELKDVIGAVKRIQELLGDLHDSDVRLEILRGLTSGPLDYRSLEAIHQLLPNPVAHGLAQLLAREVRERKSCYRAFAKEWKKLERRGFRTTCLERLQKPDAPKNEPAKTAE